MALGLGSNLIVRDGGVPGVVVRLGKAFARSRRWMTSRSTAAAGRGHSRVLHRARCRHRGLEFLRSIPGTVGGFVPDERRRLWREVKDVMVDCDVVLRSGERVTLPVADLGYTYRHSELPEGAIVIGARFRGAGRSRRDQAEMDRISAAREASQPLRSKTGGSTFKNPDGAKAWELVDRAGCRGLTVGGAQVSEKHTNFLINTGTASSADIEALGEKCDAG
jgi:UDP-N-acetylmuramate dehydrogenase